VNAGCIFLLLFLHDYGNFPRVFVYVYKFVYSP
jgi:hypothetical protein